MTTHLRQQILVQVATLVTGLTTTGTRAFRSRVYPLATAELPGLLIRQQPGATETMGDQTAQAPRRFYRTVRIQVIGLARDTEETDLDAELNQIALEVEKALAMPVASGPWKVITLTNTDIDAEGDGEQLVGRVTLTYDVEYLAREDTPDVG